MNDNLRGSLFQEPIAGELIDWFETGLEGVVWALEEDANQAYEGLHVIEEGDHLVIHARAGRILWQGIIECDRKIGRRPRPTNSAFIQQAALGHWVHWIQRGFKPDAWARFFIRSENNRLRGVLRKKEGASTGADLSRPTGW